MGIGGMIRELPPQDEIPIDETLLWLGVFSKNPALSALPEGIIRTSPYHNRTSCGWVSL